MISQIKTCMDLVSFLQLDWNKLSRTNPSDKRSAVEARHIHHVTDETSVKSFPLSPLSVVIGNSPSVPCFMSELQWMMHFFSAHIKTCLLLVLKALLSARCFGSLRASSAPSPSPSYHPDRHAVNKQAFVSSCRQIARP